MWKLLFIKRHKRRLKLHQQDLANGHGEVYLPYALERKYRNAAKEWGWQYVFYSHVLQIGASAVRSPLEQFGTTELLPKLPRISMALHDGITEMDAIPDDAD